jgi:nucleoside triphosphate diphosphatase
VADPGGLPRLLAIMARLRDPVSGCPWDRQQDFRSIAPYTIEEAYEVAEACERGDVAALREELGDLLLQVVFHARMAEEAGLFDFDAVATGIADKMVHRHPHVFGTAVIADAAAQTDAWEAQKAAERRRKSEAEGKRPSALDGVGEALPALARAEKLQRRAARVGFDWPDLPPVLDKIAEELGEVRELVDRGATGPVLAEEIGDLLFAVVNLARHAAADPEQTLRAACRKFERRFRAVEQGLAQAGIAVESASLERMEEEWQQVKAQEPQS